MEPSEIFELIIKADEKLKYSTEQNAAQRRGQAVDLLVQARDAAREAGNEQRDEETEARHGWTSISKLGAADSAPFDGRASSHTRGSRIWTPRVASLRRSSHGTLPGASVAGSRRPARPSAPRRA